MTPSSTVEKITKEEIQELLANIAKRHFGITLNDLLSKNAAGELDSCEDAEIMTLIAMLDPCGTAA